MDRRRFLKAAAGLLVPAIPAIIRPDSAWTQLSGGIGGFPGPGTVHSSGAAATTLDSGHNTGWTLSGGNLTVARVGGNTSCAVYSVAATTASQKVYVEATCNQTSFTSMLGFGVDNTITGRFGGSNITPTKGLINQTFGTYLCTDSVNNNVAMIPSWTTGDTIDLALDTGLGKFWVRKNNGGWNATIGGSQDPASGLGGVASTTTPAGPYFYFVGSDANTSDGFTIRFSSSSWVNTVPSGFTQLA